ncbi:MAG: YIP1 family protein, partial [Candidatus Heimdallarchaeota archaeon]
MQTCPSCGELVPIEYVVCVWCGFDLTAEHIRRSGIVIGRNEAFARMKRVTLDPINAFKEITLIPDLKGPRYILYLIGVAMTLNMLAIFSKLDGLAYNTEEYKIVLYTIGADTQISIKVTTIIALTFLIIQPIFLLLIFNYIWKVATRLISYLSRTVGGTGDKEKIRSILGYSLLPVLFGWSLAWILRLLSGSTEVADPKG